MFPLKLSLAASDTQRLFEDSAHRFILDCYEFSARRRRLAAQPVNFLAGWPELAARGLLTVAFPQEQGGASGRVDDIAVVVSALGSALVLEPYVEVGIVAGSLLRELGSSEHLIARIMEGDSIIVVANGQAPGRGNASCTSLRDGSIALSGRIAVVPFAPQAQQLLVAVPDEHSRQTNILLVPTDAAGVRLEPFQLLDKRPAADVVFSACRLEPAARLARGTYAAMALEQNEQLSTIAYAAEALGIMSALLCQTAEYLKTRVQFGAPIGTFQALQHRFADLYLLYREALSTLQWCLTLFAGPRAGALARALLALQWVCGESGRRIAHEAIQLHGGIGATDELAISHYNSRLVVIERLYLASDSAPGRLLLLEGFNQDLDRQHR